MPLILRQVLGSEKFIYTALLFMLPITVFTAMGLMSVDDWRHDALWALGMLISGKTLQGVADRIGAARVQTPAADQTVTVNMPTQPPPPTGIIVGAQATQPIDAAQLAQLIKPPTPTPPGGVIVGGPVEPPPPIRSGDDS